MNGSDVAAAIVLSVVVCVIANVVRIRHAETMLRRWAAEEQFAVTWFRVWRCPLGGSVVSVRVADNQGHHYRGHVMFYHHFFRGRHSASLEPVDGSEQDG